MIYYFCLFFSSHMLKEVCWSFLHHYIFLPSVLQFLKLCYLELLYFPDGFICFHYEYFLCLIIFLALKFTLIDNNMVIKYFFVGISMVYLFPCFTFNLSVRFHVLIVVGYESCKLYSCFDFVVILVVVKQTDNYCYLIGALILFIFNIITEIILFTSNFLTICFLYVDLFYGSFSLLFSFISF